MISGFVTGALARLAVPGPDPMPIWLTMAIGLAGSIVGYGIAAAIFGGDNITAISLIGFVTAVLLVLVYRRFVQKRPLLGPGALRFPERGVGVAGQRERLKRFGMRFESADRSPPAAPAAAGDATNDLLVNLNELHRAGVLTDDEYRAKRELVLGRDG